MGFVGVRCDPSTEYGCGTVWTKFRTCCAHDPIKRQYDWLTVFFSRFFANHLLANVSMSCKTDTNKEWLKEWQQYSLGEQSDCTAMLCNSQHSLTSLRHACTTVFRSLIQAERKKANEKEKCEQDTQKHTHTHTHTHRWQ